MGLSRYFRMIFVFCLFFVISLDLFGVTASNKNITIRLTGSWDPFNMGWEPDELLISPTNILNKPYGQIVNQNDLTNNGGQMLKYYGFDYENKCESTNDSVYPGKDTDTLTKAELSELWLTWDTNYIYFAVRGQAAGRHNNLMIYFDREPGKGRTSFVESIVVWNRGVFFSGMDPDMYIGFWNPNDSVELDPFGNRGGVQLYSLATGDEELGISSYQDTGNVPGSPNMNSNVFDFFFNGAQEPDMFKRVAIGKIRWDVFLTNVNPTNMWLKIAVATTGPDSGNFNYEYMPDNSSGVDPSSKSVQDNFVMIKVTDGDGKPRIGVNVRNEAFINFYPGVQIRPTKSPRFFAKVFRGSLEGVEDDKPKVLAPTKGDKVKVRFDIKDVTEYIFEGYIKIYDEKGNLVRTLAEKILLTDNPSAIQYSAKPGVYESHYKFIWDGKDDKGNTVPMGNYVLVVGGKNVGGLDIIATRLISVIY